MSLSLVPELQPAERLIVQGDGVLVQGVGGSLIRSGWWQAAGKVASVVRGLLAGMVGVVVAAGVVGGAAAHRSGASGVIAYQGNGKVYLINADGSGRRPLVSGVADRGFAWSHDGREIAFTAGEAPVRTPDDPTEIDVVAADGTGARLVTSAPSHTARSPMWSPDGKQIVYEGWNKQNHRWHLYLIGAGGKGLRALTRGSSMSDESPDWSPDGQWIIFDRYRFQRENDPRHALMAIHPDGAGLHLIATLIAGPQCLCPDWSPDGSKIAYQASPDASSSSFPEIYVMNADGSGQTRLTANKVRDENPDWSPDGTTIAFYSERAGNAEIYVINADGSGVRRVTRDPWYSAIPRWRPTPG